MVTEHEIKLITRISRFLHYSDDTHMTIGTAESLLECHGFNGVHMASRFIDNYSRLTGLPLSVFFLVTKSICLISQGVRFNLPRASSSCDWKVGMLEYGIFCD